MAHTVKRYERLKVLSWNCNTMNVKSKNRVALANFVFNNNIDVACLQETRQMETFKISGFQTFISPASEGEFRGLAILVRNRIKVVKVAKPKLNTKTDTLTVKLTLEDKEVYITSLYHSHDNNSVSPLVSRIVNKYPLNHLIVGDFNCHHSAWGRNNQDKAQGISLLNNILNSPGRLSCLNTGEPTRGSSGLSMDLSLATSDISAHADWQVDERLSSDHYATVTTLGGVKQVAPPIREPRPNAKKADWSIFNKVLTDLAESTDFSDYSNWKEAMGTALSAACPKTKHSQNRSKRWWHNTDRSKAAQARVNRAHANFRRYQTDYNRRILKTAEFQAKQIHDQEKEVTFRSWLEEINQHTSTTELWRKVKILKGCTVTPLLPNAQAEADKLALEFTNRTKKTNLPASHIACLDKLEPGRLVVINTALARPSPAGLDGPITSQEVDRHISATKNKAPGSDQIPVIALKNLNKDNRKILVSILNNVFQSSIIPRDWPKGHIVPIPKPGQPDAKRPITLLQTASKLMERVVCDRMKYSIYISGHKTPTEQFGFRPARSAQHCFSTMIDLLYKAKGQKANSIVIYLDLEKAFELIDHTVLLAALAARGVQGKILAYIKSYLEGRSARVGFQGKMSDYYELENGVPQGGILSPTIFNMVVEEIHALHLPNTQILSYADDIAIVVTKKGWNPETGTAFTIAQKALNLVAAKCCELGLKISPAKTKAISFFNTNYTAKLSLGTQLLDWDSTYKYLGIIFDRQLTFIPEMRYLLSRMHSRINILNSISGITWGASEANLNLFYCNGIRSIVDYAAPALITALPSTYGGTVKLRGTAGMFQKLEKAQNIALRAILSAPRLTKVTLMRREANICPLISRIRNIGYKCLVSMASNIDCRLGEGLKQKFRNLGNSNYKPTIPISRFYKNMLYHMTKKDIRNFKPSCLTPFNPLRTVPVFVMVEHDYKKSEISPAILKQCVLEQNHRLTTMFPEAQNVYTDGSVMPLTGQCGSGIHNETINETESRRVLNNSSTLTTELVAIKVALDTWDTSMTIHTDSLGSVQNISNCRTTNELAIEVQSCIINRASRGLQTILHWIPSHIGIRGNDKADEAAKEGTSLPLPIEVETEPLQPRTLSRANINKLALEEWDLNEVQDKLLNPFSQSRDWHTLIRETLPLVPRHVPKSVRHVATRFRIGHRRWADVNVPKWTKYDRCYCGNSTFDIPHALVTCNQMVYDHIIELKDKANNGVRNPSEQALEIMRLAAQKDYAPLVAFYFQNEEMFW